VDLIELETKDEKQEEHSVSFTLQALCDFIMNIQHHIWSFMFLNLIIRPKSFKIQQAAIKDQDY
jgi:hypothetical protein